MLLKQIHNSIVNLSGKNWKHHFKLSFFILWEFLCHLLNIWPLDDDLDKCVAWMYVSLMWKLQLTDEGFHIKLTYIQATHLSRSKDFSAKKQRGQCEVMCFTILDYFHNKNGIFSRNLHYNKTNINGYWT